METCAPIEPSTSAIEAVGLLEAQASRPHDLAATLRERRERRDRRDEVGAARDVDARAMQGIPPGSSGSSAPCHLRSEERERPDHRAVRLLRDEREPLDLDAHIRERAGGEPERRVRPVAAHLEGPWGAVRGLGGKQVAGERPRADDLRADPERLEHVEAERDVGARFDGFRHTDLARTVDQRCGEQDAGDVLRGDVAGKLENAGRDTPGDGEGEGAVRVDDGAMRAERCDERAERALGEPGGSGERGSAERSGDGEQEPQRGAGFTAVEDTRGRTAAFEGNDREPLAVTVDLRPERLEAADRGIDIFG